jgi:hypothetical protein
VKTCRNQDGVCCESGHACSSDHAVPVELVEIDAPAKQIVGFPAGDGYHTETE